jgi:DNA-binding CsgD family transcriptional regulator
MQRDHLEEELTGFQTLPATRRALPMSAAREDGHILVPVGLFAGIALLIAADLASDYRAGHWPLHFILEILAGGLALAGTGLFARHAWTIHKAAEDLERDLRAKEREAQEWREEARQALEGLGSAIDREFAKWGLTDAERDIALQLLKGLSHKEIASQRRTAEGTVRQQALAIYRKAGLEGRSNLAAFFLEGLTLPQRPV